MLLALKIVYSERIVMLRGNHECRDTSRMYGFYDECIRKYGSPNAWRAAMQLFDTLPIAALIEDRVLCVHGGISPDLASIDQINLLARDQEIPMEGLLSDLMWSDPEPAIDTWNQSSRGTGFLFGAKAVRQFNRMNGTSMIARAHQIAEEGFHFPLDDESVVTVWSAPNYMYRNSNKASVMHLDVDGARRFWVFEAVPDSERVPPPRDFFYPAAFL